MTSTRAELFNTHQRAEIVSAELIESNKALAQKVESQIHWQSQHEKVYVKWEGQIKLSADLQTQNIVFSQQMMVIKKELDVLAEQNKLLAHDKWILGQEKAQLFGQLKQWESMAATG